MQCCKSYTFYLICYCFCEDLCSFICFFFLTFLCMTKFVCFASDTGKTRRGRPVNNIPSTNIKKMTPDTRHLTPDTWHLTCDAWHVTCDTWWGVNLQSKVQLSSSNDLKFMMSWSFGGKVWLTNWLNQLNNEWLSCL